MARGYTGMYTYTPVLTWFIFPDFVAFFELS